MEAGLKEWAFAFWLGGAIVFGLIAHLVFFKTAGALARRSESAAGGLLVKRCRAPLQLVFPLICVHLVLPMVALSPEAQAFLKQILAPVLVISTAWLIVRLIMASEDLILQQFKMDEKDNLRARQIHTQLRIFRKIAVVVVGILALGVVLLTFDKVRHLGTSILASAGIAGIIVGLAAQRSIGTLLAGIQIAVTQPIRLDDVVVVEDEWGRIEDITLTYVVVRIWDLRRLILPVTYFLEKPFQNWTRVSAELLGTVFIYADYTVSVDAVREELHRILQASNLWDGHTWGLLVTNASERTVELRALMSAQDSSSVWSLRCEVREKLIAFMQEKYPDSLPRVRAELGNRPNSSDPTPE